MDSTEDGEGSENILHDTTTVAICHHTSVQTKSGQPQEWTSSVTLDLGWQYCVRAG